MPFLHPLIFIIGAIGISVPILIHILNRRRHKIVQWAAMKFLLAAIKKNNRRLRIEEIIMIILRCLIVLIAGIMLARFTGCSGNDDIAKEILGKQSLIFVLDDSSSMGQTRGNINSFDRAKNDIIKRIEHADGQSEIAIILTSDKSAKKAFKTLAQKESKDHLVNRIKGLVTSDFTKDLALTIEESKQFLSKATGSKQLIIMSDFRAHDLSKQSFKGRLKTVLDSINSKFHPKLIFMDYGQVTESNLTVEQIAQVDPQALLKSTGGIEMKLTVRNNASKDAMNVPVSLRMITKNSNGELKFHDLPTVTIPHIPAGQISTEKFTIQPSKAGYIVIEASLPEDELKADNVAQFSINVKNAIKVLMVDGNYVGPNKRYNESFLLSAVLDPNSNGNHGCITEIIKPDQLDDVQFKDFDLIMIMDVKSFPLKADAPKNDINKRYPAIPRLKKYMEQGGSVVFFSGDHLDKNFYNKELFAQAKMIPFMLGKTIGDASDKSSSYRIDSLTLNTTGLMKPFEGQMQITASTIPFYRLLKPKLDIKRKKIKLTNKQKKYYLELGMKIPSFKTEYQKVPAGVTVEAEIRHADGTTSPLIASRKIGRGMSVMFYATASERWHDWHLQEEAGYLVFFKEFVNLLLRTQEGDKILYAGTPLEMPVPEGHHESKIEILPPGIGQVTIPLDIDKTGAFPAVRYNNMTKAGMYQVIMKKIDKTEDVVMVVRNLDPSEGKLKPGLKDAIKAAFPEDADVIYSNRVMPESKDKADKMGFEKNYWIWFAAALLALLCIESVLGLKFGHWQNKN